MDTKENKYLDRLDKAEYTKDEVAKLLHSEADYSARTTRKEFANTVSRDEYDTLNDELTSVKSVLKPYQEAEHKANIGTAFAKLNGNEERLADFTKLGGIKDGMTSDEIFEVATELKKTGQYDFLFKKGDSGVITPDPKEPIKPSTGAITPKGGLLNRLLNKNKKT